MGSYSPTGCRWMSFTGAAGTNTTATRWPSDGAGGVTATNTASLTAAMSSSNVYGVFLINAGAAGGNIIIKDHSGTALPGHTIAIVAGTTVPQRIPIGGPDGLVFPTGISASVSAVDIQCSIYFNKGEGPTS